MRHRFAGDPHSDSGFTLLELLIVIVVLGVIASIVIFAVSGTTARAAVSACRSDVNSVETAIRAYATQNNGQLPSALSDLTTAPDPLLASLPASPYYAISWDSSTGELMVTSPPTGGTALPSSSPQACDGAALAGGTPSTTSASGPTTTAPRSTTTVAPTTTTAPPTTTTTTTTTVPPTTTTTTTTTSTTTTTTVPSNGVTVTTAYANSGRSLYDELTIMNNASITSLSVTIDIKITGSESYQSVSSGYPRGTTSTSHRTSPSTISYSMVLAARHTIAANSTGSLTATYRVRSGTHPVSGDTWIVTSVSNGNSNTVSGSF